MDANGDGYTANQSLPNGHYKLFWNFTGENGAAKQKVFWVKCPAATPTQAPTTPCDDTDVTGTYLHLRQHTADHPTADHPAGPDHADARRWRGLLRRQRR